MTRDRRAAVKQADISRAIKALEAAGYKVGAVRLGKEGFEVVPAIPATSSVIQGRFDGKPRRIL